MEHEQSKRTRKSLEQHGEDGSASHGALMLSIVARISSVLAQIRRSPSQDGRSIRLLERCERHENHNSLEDRRSPEHPPPRRSKRHESTDDRPWSFVSIMVPKPQLSRGFHMVCTNQQQPPTTELANTCSDSSPSARASTHPSTLPQLRHKYYSPQTQPETYSRSKPPSTSRTHMQYSTRGTTRYSHAALYFFHTLQTKDR
jgi:hypothetical protein